MKRSNYITREGWDRLDKELKYLSMKYLKPSSYLQKDNTEVLVANNMGGETDWFILPHTFGITIGKKMFEQKNAGLEGFQEDGFNELKSWLIEYEIIDDSMCY